MRLDELMRGLPEAELHGDPGTRVVSVTHDSRQCDVGAVFVAIRGLAADGNDFVEAARKKGAAAVVSEEPPSGDMPWGRVRDAREALAVLSAAAQGHPGRELDLVGITGTNGKTTTAYMIDAAIREAGQTSGLLGTVAYRIGDRVAEAVRTTPESSDLQALLRQMVDGGCRRAVLEVSSHSLVLRRVHGLEFAVAVFTNLTRDHLDFHGDMETYFAAKRILFDTLLREDGRVVVNIDDDYGAELARTARRPVWTCSLVETAADFSADNVRLSLEGTRFTARTPAGVFEVQTALLGRFSVRNALCAFAAGQALGLPPDAVQRGIASLRGVPGRIERVDAGQDFTVLVDYAHTDDALKNLLETVRELDPRRLITVFGCGGDRDRTKRPLMGAVAARLSDVVILTSDNPRTEPPEAIIDDIRRGIPSSRAEETEVVVDRREAITRALELGREGVVIVIAGKGHETEQVTRDRRVPFDDRKVVREVLARPSRAGGRR